MTTNTANQGITIQTGTDLANEPSAQVSLLGVAENRLVQRYTNATDRTARNAAPNENELSALASEDRYEVFDTSNWTSLFTRSIHTYARVTADQSLAQSSTTLQNITSLVATLPTAGTFGFDALVFYDASTAAKMQFAFTWPTGALSRWGASGLMNSSVSNNGDARYATATTSGASGSIQYGAAGVTNVVFCRFDGSIVMGGTGGPLQLQAAQAVSDATAITIRSHSYLRVWRIV